MTLTQAIEKLNSFEQTLHAYNTALDVLNYDGETCAPEKSINDRANSMGVISGLIHQMMTAPETGEMLDTILQAREQADPVVYRRAEVLAEDRQDMTCIPAAEYAEYCTLVSKANAVWHTAKTTSDFQLFRPYLEQIVESNRRFARYKDAEKPLYDIVLNDYEKGMDMPTLDSFFGLLQRELTPVILAVKDSPQPRTDFLYRRFPIDRQKAFSTRLMDIMGIDPSRCCIGETEHPFTAGSSRSCVRITTHYFEDRFASSMFSVIHEGGHALYELGTGEALEGTVLGTGSSMGVHESQSRFYENLIGRSRPFCRYLLPVLQEIFPEQLADVTAEEFYTAINQAEPSLIRTEADELTYPMHVMIRYELEKRLMSGDLVTADLPGAWNEMYKKYLGVTVPDDRHGVLQDSHWAGGAIGYFPSYALGSAYGAQMLTRLEQDVPGLWQQVEQGDLTPVTNWLGEKIHHYGKLLTPAQLVENAVGGAFDPHFYVDYLKNKYTELYRL